MYKCDLQMCNQHTYNLLIGQTLWPVLMFTTTLPPMIRMNSENMMVGALWLGPCKPPMEALLHPVLSKIENLQKTGITFPTSKGMKTLKAKLLVGVFDQPAKAMVLNVVQYNGHYGCPYCLDHRYYSRRIGNKSREP